MTIDGLDRDDSVQEMPDSDCLLSREIEGLDDSISVLIEYSDVQLHSPLVQGVEDHEITVEMEVAGETIEQNSLDSYVDRLAFREISQEELLVKIVSDLSSVVDADRIFVGIESSSRSHSKEVHGGYSDR